MKNIIFISIVLFNINAYSQSISIEERIKYIEETNNQTFTTLGNNNLLYYECVNDCNTVIINITEKYWRGIKTSKRQKQDLGKSLLEQYTFLFLSKGFKILTIKIEGIEPITKELKLDR